MVGDLPDGYRQLAEQAIAVFEDDDRVQAAWIHGSRARDDFDEVSDLDVIVAVADDDLTAFGEGWRPRLAEITPTVMARRFFGPGGSWLAITPECLRFDLWVEAADAVPTSPVKDRRLLFDRAGLDPLVPAPDPEAPPSPAKFDEWRAWASGCRAVAAEADELLALEVVHTLRWILYHAYVESNRPLPKTGLKQWSRKLTAPQRATLERLPTRGDPSPIIDALDEVLGLAPEPAPAPSVTQIVFPPEGLIRGVFLPAEPPESRGRHIAEEFFALHLYLSVVLHRQDWLLGIEGVHSLRRLIYELDLEENGRRPAETLADWQGRLTPDQRDELLALPTGAATRANVIAGHRAVRDAFIERGRRLLGDEYPSALADAVRSYLDRGQ